jgi:hypothetical protein
LTGQGLDSQSTVLHGQHANNYTTDAVTWQVKDTKVETSHKYFTINWHWWG